MAFDAFKSGDRAVEILLAEYKRATGEIIERLKMQKQVENIIVVVVSALIGGSSFIMQHNLTEILPLGSVLLSILMISFFEQDINIAILARYCHNDLRINLQKLIEDDEASRVLLTWESFRNKIFIKSSISGYLTANRTSLLYIPPVIPLGVFGYISYKKHGGWLSWSFLEVCSAICAVLALCVAMYIAVQVPRIYKEIVVPYSGDS